MLATLSEVESETAQKREPRTWLERQMRDIPMDIETLARRSGMSYSQTWDIVAKGIRPGTRIGNIEKIAAVVGISVVALLDNQKRAE